MTRRFLLPFSFAILLLASLAPILPASAQDASTSIETTGPLTRILTTDTLNCAVNHANDAQGEFFGDTACGTFFAAGGTLFGPSYIPAGSTGNTAYTPVDGPTLAGSGTLSDPYHLTTTVQLGSTGLRIRQVDRYVAGQVFFRTDVQIINNTASDVSGILYRAGDCYLAESDEGFGLVRDNGTVGCRNELRVEEFIPITSGSRYYEADFAEVWQAVGSMQPFPNTTRASEFIDNGAGLSWNVTVPANGSRTVSSSLSFGDPPPATAPLARPTTTTGTVYVDPDSGRVTVAMPTGNRSDITFATTPETEEGCTITGVVLTLGGSQFPMSDSDGDGTYTVTVPASSVVEGDINIIVETDCGSTTELVGTIDLYDPSGIVTDADTGEPIEGAEVTLWHVPGWEPQTSGNTGSNTCETTQTNGGTWDQPAPTGEGEVANPNSGTMLPAFNPFTTTAIGYYGWDVAEGCWYVTVEADGYQPLTSPVVGVPPAVTDLDLQLMPEGPPPATPACDYSQIPSAGFSDVPSGSVHRYRIDCAAWWEVVNGTSSTTYAPSARVNRAQMASFIASLIEATGTELPAATSDHFSDDNGLVHEPNINALAEAGIVSGAGTGTYAPGTPVNRAQMATFLANAYEFVAGQALPAGPDAFGDDNDTLHEPSINRLAAAEIVAGTSSTTYSPGSPVSRAQMATFLANMLDQFVTDGLA